MESYSEWRVTVYDVIFGELKFLDSHTTYLSELYQKSSLGELTVNGNSPDCYVAKIWRVSRYNMFYRMLFVFVLNPLVYSHA